MRRIKNKRIRLLLNVLFQKIKDHMAHRNGLAALKNTTTLMKVTQITQMAHKVKRKRTALDTSSSIAMVDSTRFSEL